MNTRVTVTTGCRLHFGPFACGATEGRRFGGVGAMIDAPRCTVEVVRSEVDEIDAGPRTGRIAKTVAAYRDGADAVNPPVRIRLVSDIPGHRGFGSGTQLALAIAKGLSIIAGEPEVAAELLASRVGRGVRSAIGTHGFQRGGLIVDAGKEGDERIGALAARVELPSDWRWLLVTPLGRGVSGDRELASLASLPPMSAATTEQLRSIINMELLPAARAGDVAAFGKAVRCYGEIVGEFFAPAQGGTVADPIAAELLPWFASRGVHGVAQSSWGPTIAALLPDADMAEALQAELAQRDPRVSCELRIARPRNVGATVVVEPGQ